MLKIKENISLAQYTTLKVGGLAKFFCEAQDEEEILEAVNFAKKKNLPIFVLGGGSNILVSDRGFDGLIIKILTTHYKLLATSIECGSGCQLSTIVNESIKAELRGLEWAAGIPGTVGGAVRGNAGAFGGCMADCVNSLKVFDTGSLALLGMTVGDCQFSYRDSIFKQNPNLIILSVILSLKKGEKEGSEKKIREIIASRKAVQPADFPSSGSFFKNPCLSRLPAGRQGSQAVVKNNKLIAEYEADTGKKVKDGIIPAGYLVDALNLRGKKIGGAMVSQEHGNFLVNSGNATAEDFVILMSLIKQKVRVHYGIQLQEEVQLVGF